MCTSSLVCWAPIFLGCSPFLNAPTLCPLLGCLCIDVVLTSLGDDVSWAAILPGWPHHAWTLTPHAEPPLHRYPPLPILSYDILHSALPTFSWNMISCVCPIPLTSHGYSPHPAWALIAPAGLTPCLDVPFALSDSAALLPTLLHGYLLSQPHLMNLCWFLCGFFWGGRLVRKSRERKGREQRQKDFKGAKWNEKELISRDLIQIKIHCLSPHASLLIFS